MAFSPVSTGRGLILSPIKVPNARVEPLRPGESSFRLSDNELYLFDSIAAEQVNIIGTDIDYYSLSVEKSTRDPLYDEPSERVWSKAYKMRAWMSWSSSTPLTGEEGIRLIFQAQAWIARSEVERARCPAPTQGDVLRVWNIPYFNLQAASGDSSVPNAGYFFDVLNADNDGHVNDTSSFVGFKLDLRRRAEYGAERKIDPP